MLVHRTSWKFKLAVRTPAWLCTIMQARVGSNTRDYFSISRPYWMR